jgi:hypothetical protein
MQYSPVIKLSSFGKGHDSDLANARYISRFGTLQDEMGNHISQKQRYEAVGQRLMQVHKSSFRVIVSLPSSNTDRAKDEVIEEIRNRYSSFLTAYHISNDKGEKQPHMHFLIFNDQKNHRLKDRNEIFSLRNAIGERFRKNNISFPLSHEIRPKLSQAEIHMKEQGQTLWKDDIRNAVSHAFSRSHDFDSFISHLNQHGISIVRETPNSLTFQDLQGNKARLDKLFPRMKNRQDIINHITHKEGNMKKKEDLLRAERSFVNRVNSHMEDMIRHGVSETQVQSRIEKILQHRTESEDIDERWNALKLQQEELKEERQNWHEEKQKIRQQQYEQQRMEREREYQEQRQMQTLQRVLSSGNPISAFAATLVLIISEIKRQQQKQQKQQNINNEKEIMRDIMNTKETLKNPEPEPFRGPER